MRRRVRQTPVTLAGYSRACFTKVPQQPTLAALPAPAVGKHTGTNSEPCRLHHAMLAPATIPVMTACRRPPVAPGARAATGHRRIIFKHK
jgi:hypothetical protein